MPRPFLDGKKLPVAFMDFEPEANKTFLSEADQALTNFFAPDSLYQESISRLV